MTQTAGATASQRKPTEFDLQGRPAWPTMFFFRKWREHPEHAPAIIEHFYEMKAGFKQNIESGVAVTAKSDMGLIESTLDLFEVTRHPGLQQLSAFLLDSVRAVVAHVNGNRILPQKLDTRYTDSWFHITNGHGYHDAHYHSACSWCGIFYVRAGSSTGTSDKGAGNGINRFYSPLPTGGLLGDYGNAYLSSNRIDIVPQDGMVFLFPSYVLHSALAYDGPDDRIVIAFNTTTTVKQD